jgi:hypothetical protein
MTATRRRRLRGEHGMAMVTGLVLIFSFTALGVIWLARDVSRTVGNRTVAQSIAFQAARSGAQQVQVGSLRDGGDADVVTVDGDRARSAATATATQLFEDYGVDGVVISIEVPENDLVVVEVEIRDPTRDVRGVASARAEEGP